VRRLRRRAADRAKTDQSPLIDALRLIDRHGCESYTSDQRCSDPGSGRIRGARYGSEAWCDPCIAADALRRVER
jgi:hypothetical protein